MGFVDPNGLDVYAVVTSMANAGPGVGAFGHMGFFVGNDSTGYTFYGTARTDEVMHTNEMGEIEGYISPDEVVHTDKAPFGQQYQIFSHTETSYEKMLSYLRNNAPGKAWNHEKGYKEGNGYDRIARMLTSLEHDGQFINFLNSFFESTEYGDLSYGIMNGNCSSLTVSLINSFFGEYTIVNPVVDIPNALFDMIEQYGNFEIIDDKGTSLRSDLTNTQDLLMIIYNMLTTGSGTSETSGSRKDAGTSQNPYYNVQ